MTYSSPNNYWTTSAQLSHLLEDDFWFNSLLLVKFLASLTALYSFGPYQRLRNLWRRFSSLLISTVTISCSESVYEHMIKHLANHRTFRANSSLWVTSIPEWGLPPLCRKVDFEEENATGVQLFFHNGWLFFTSRLAMKGFRWVGNSYKPNKALQISCFGRSTEPLKELVELVHKTSKHKQRDYTIIKRPDNFGYDNFLGWLQLKNKRKRHIDNVFLDADPKEQLIADVKEYRTEETANFYANHGIPYRRGYLFHGPPGTGKSSFALALAGHFDLDVYILSLLDKDVTDGTLMNLMTTLPTGALVFLEDIDVAELDRSVSAAVNTSVKATPTDSDENSDSSPKTFSKGVSNVTLSGLLNAIDGVCASEGHILLMTTNNLDSLDTALVRAGRINERVHFAAASAEQAYHIFLHLYSMREGLDTSEPARHSALSRKEPWKRSAESASAYLPREEVKELALAFKEVVQGVVCSPADVQDYLLKHKRQPREAVSGVPDWIVSLKEQRTRKEKLAREGDEKEAENSVSMVEPVTANSEGHLDLVNQVVSVDGSEVGIAENASFK